ncbi:MAG: hypothetical protein ABI120_23745 [Gemmatimonadaceae bacterium]
MNTVAELRVGALMAGWALLAVMSVRNVHAQQASRTDNGRINLVVRPHVGDTLWLHLEQTMDTRSGPVTEARSGSAGTGGVGSARSSSSSAPEYGPFVDRSTTQSTFLRLNAHSTVEFSDLRTTALTVVTDSLSMRMGTGGQLGPARPVALAAGERRTLVNVTADGAMTVMNPGASSATLAAGLSGMPPMLPSRPVAIGDRWERDVPLPSLPMTGVRTDGIVRAQFRFDSLTRGGRLAYISLTGTLHREGAARDLPTGTQVATSGVLRGYLIVDRTRGWITEAETVIEVQSEVTPRAGDTAKARALDIRLLQRMRVR